MTIDRYYIVIRTSSVLAEGLDCFETLCRIVTAMSLLLHRVARIERCRMLPATPCCERAHY